MMLAPAAVATGSRAPARRGMLDATHADLLHALGQAERGAFDALRDAAPAPPGSRPNRVLCLTWGPPEPVPARANQAGSAGPRRCVLGQRWLGAGPGTPELFVEGLQSLASTRSDEAVVHAMLERARQLGWRQLALCGSADFRRRVERAARARGLLVEYRPRPLPAA